MKDAARERPDCFRCAHFKVTWKPDWPYECQAFGIRAKALPSIEIERSSGKGCQGFEPKPLPKPKERR